MTANDRVANLESQVRWLKRFVGGLVLAFAAFMSIAAVRQDNPFVFDRQVIVTGRSFVVQDRDGKDKVTLGADGNVVIMGKLKVNGVELEEHLSRTAAPIGTIVAFAGEWPPWREPDPDWMLCDGRALPNNEDYKQLFSVIGTSWGDGSTGDNAQPGITKFNLPDLRGVFLRGVNGNAQRDPEAANRAATRAGENGGNRVGSLQGDQLKVHAHTISDPGHAHEMGAFCEGGNIYDSGDRRSAWAYFGCPIRSTSNATTGISINNAGGAETRPVNAAVYWIIRYKSRACYEL